MINMLWALMDKVNSTQEQMGNVSREMEIRRTKRNAKDKKTQKTPTVTELCDLILPLEDKIWLFCGK